MKSILGASLLGFTLLFSLIAAFFGAGIMLYDLYSDGPDFMKGFTIFCLGSTLFFAGVTAFIATKILTNTEVLAVVMEKMVVNEITKSAQGNMNPLQALFGNLGAGMGFPNAGTIKMGKLDEEGNVTPLGEKEFNSPDEFIQYRNEILQKAFGQAPGKKEIQDMTIPELEAEEKKAVKSQNFELAAAIRDLIQEKSGKKS